MRGGFVRRGPLWQPLPRGNGAAGERGRFLLAEHSGPAPGEVGIPGVRGSLGAVWLLCCCLLNFGGNATCEGSIPVIPVAVLGRQSTEAQPSVG